MHYHVLNNSIVLNYDGKTVVVSKDDRTRYDGVLECIRTNRLTDIPAIVEIERAFESSGWELRDGILYNDGNPIPSELNARILSYKEQNIPYTSLLKFWENLKLNPSYNSKQMLYKFLENNGHPFTEDGYFIAYRGVTAEFKDKHTGRFDNSIGAVCKENRALVDDNPNNTCSRGLHVACFDYAKGFGEKVIEVKVHPRDVVCVPTDYNGTKMRVCEFTVIAVTENMRNETVYGFQGEIPENTVEFKSTEDEDYEDGENGDLNDCPHCGESDAAFYNFCPNCGCNQD